MDSWDHIFRSFFNIPKFPSNNFDRWEFDDHPPDGHFVDRDDDDDDHDDEDMFGHYHDHDHDPFRHFGNFTFRFTEPDEMFRHFEEMFKDLGMADFPPPNRGSLGPGDHPSSDNVSPRDRMLKERTERPAQKEPERGSVFGFDFGNLWKRPHWDRIRPQDKVDKELDASDSGVLDEIVRGSRSGEGGESTPRREEAPGWFQSSYKSVSVKTVRRPDGSVEQVRTVRGSDGSEETTVTRSHGDQSHSVTTTRTPDGEEKTQTFTNVDEHNLGKFQSQWPDSSTPLTRPRLEERDEETKSIFQSLFGFSLPGFRRT